MQVQLLCYEYNYINLSFHITAKISFKVPLGFEAGFILEHSAVKDQIPGFEICKNFLLKNFRHKLLI